MTETVRTLIVASAVLLIICVGWFFFLYKPEIAKLQVLKEDTEKLMLKLQSLRVNDEQLKALQKQAELQDTELRRLEARLVHKEDLPMLVTALKRRGKRFGLRFDRILPDYDHLMEGGQENPARALKLVIHLKLQGRYKSLGKFIDSLNDLPYLLSVGEVTLNYDQRIYPELEIILDVAAYLQETAAAEKFVEMSVR
ncbi:MAG: hypothetical protein D6743_10280 [Calditrichaeota bacterium]|nr:MAG: hypothetical protein D6743_10280 [Calditrichota bacterium]